MSSALPPQGQPEYGQPRNAKAEAKAAKAYYKSSRPWYKKKRFILPLALLALIIVIASLSGGGGDDPSTTATDDASEAPAAKKKAPTPKAMKVRAVQILTEFEGNEASADAKYRGKTLRVSGIVEKVDTEFVDDEQYVIQLAGGGDFVLTTVNCDDQPSSVATKVNKGDKVTVVGQFEDGGDLGIELKDCKVA